VFADSTIDLPYLLRVAHQPDLNLFKTTGYPYTGSGEKQSQIILLDGEPRTISSAWTISAKLASLVDRPLYQLAMGHEPMPDRGHQIMVGTVESNEDGSTAGLAGLTLRPRDREELSQQLVAAVEDRNSLASVRIQAAPEAAGEAKLIETASLDLNGVEGGAASSSQDRDLWVQKLGLERGSEPEFSFNWIGTVQASVLDIREQVSTMASDFGSATLKGTGLERRASSPAGVFDGVMAAYETTGTSRHTTTMIVANDGEALQNAVFGLVQDKLWNQLDGSTAAWNVSPAEVQTVSDSSFRSGPLPEDWWGKVLYANNYLAEKPTMWVGIMAGAALLMGLIVSAVVPGRRR
jgi:hypothetical protein